MHSRNRSTALTHHRRLMGLCMTFICFFAGPKAYADTSSKAVTSSNVTVQAFADRDALVPGGTINLAIVAAIDDAWHIYWQNPGPMGGLPTVISWKAPPGFDIGRTMFPIPEVETDPVLKADSLVLKGKAVFVTPLRVPENLQPGRDIELSAVVSYLACKQQCIPGKATVTLSLPVQSSGQDKPANAEVFEKAQRGFPDPPAKAEHLRFTARLDQASVKPGQKAQVILDVVIAAGHHMQSHKPLEEGLIPAAVFVESVDGFEIGDAEYPPAHERKVAGDQKFSEYSGSILIKVPLTADDDAGKQPRWARGILQYQICTDSGTCYQPQHVEWIVPIQMEGGPAPTSQPSLTSPATPVSASPPSAGLPADSSLPATSTDWLTRTQDYLIKLGYFGVLILAFIGGLIMNLMPCVLPVISLKVLSFVRQAQEDRKRILALGLTYCLGIMVFFSFIAVLFLWNGTGWGQLFQRPHVVLGLAAVVTAFALSLFGVFAVFTPKVINVLAEKAEGEGHLSAFTTGLLATFLGTACTAPFLSAAVGAASKFPGAQGAGIFLAVGLGMAFPFVLLSAKPGWLRFIPRPGPWMGTFEAVMGFLLLGTVIWLMNPLRSQIGDYGLLLSLIFLLGVGLAVWVKGKIQFSDPPGRKFRVGMLALLLLAIGWLLPFRVMATIPDLVRKQIERLELIADGQLLQTSGLKSMLTLKPPKWPAGDREIPWQRYDRAMTLRAVQDGYTIFIDYTADWCANCKIMLKTAIEQPSVIKTMKELNVIPLTADYTSDLPEIKADLERFKRAGVPVFAVYSPGKPDAPELLPEVITSQMLIDALNRAGPSKPKP
jgi:thiol:disulfide interchange protein